MPHRTHSTKGDSISQQGMEVGGGRVGSIAPVGAVQAAPLAHGACLMVNDRVVACAVARCCCARQPALHLTWAVLFGSPATTLRSR